MDVREISIHLHLRHKRKPNAITTVTTILHGIQLGVFWQTNTIVNHLSHQSNNFPQYNKPMARVLRHQL